MTEWVSVEELLSAQTGLHDVEVNVYGKALKVYWAELENDEFPSLVPSNVEKMSQVEKMEFISRLNEDITFAMIEKGQKMKEARDGELKAKFTKETFKSLRPRIRSEIITAIWQSRDGKNQNL